MNIIYKFAKNRFWLLLQILKLEFILIHAGLSICDQIPNEVSLKQNKKVCAFTSKQTGAILHI